MKKVLISGSGSGLGRALALCYAKNNAEICVSDVNQEGGEETVSLIESAGGSAFFMPCDITQQWDVDKLGIALAERWGALDLLINNAGVATAGQIDYESMEQWQWVLDINVLGQVRMVKGMLPLLRKSNGADKGVINIASQAGITASPAMGSYCASKAAVVSLSETFHVELASEGMHVSVVCPAFFDTNLNKSLRTGDKKMVGVVDKMVTSSGVTADSIAEKIRAGFEAQQFMIVTHKDGRKVHRLKRFFPTRYLNMVKKRTAKYIKPPAQ